jgi:HEAT repeat protein
MGINLGSTSNAPYPSTYAYFFILAGAGGCGKDAMSIIRENIAVLANPASSQKEVVEAIRIIVGTQPDDDTKLILVWEEILQFNPPVPLDRQIALLKGFADHQSSRSPGGVIHDKDVLLKLLDLDLRGDFFTPGSSANSRLLVLAGAVLTTEDILNYLAAKPHRETKPSTSPQPLILVPGPSSFALLTKPNTKCTIFILKILQRKTESAEFYAELFNEQNPYSPSIIKEFFPPANDSSFLLFFEAAFKLYSKTKDPDLLQMLKSQLTRADPLFLRNFVIGCLLSDDPQVSELADALTNLQSTEFEEKLDQVFVDLLSEPTPFLRPKLMKYLVKKQRYRLDRLYNQTASYAAKSNIIQILIAIDKNLTNHPDQYYPEPYFALFLHQGDPNQNLAYQACSYLRRWEPLPFTNWNRGKKAQWFKDNWKPEYKIWYPEIAELAGKTQDPKYTGALITALELSTTTRNAAAAALVSIGTPAVPDILKYIYAHRSSSAEVNFGLKIITQIAREIGEPAYQVISNADSSYARHLTETTFPSSVESRKQDLQNLIAFDQITNCQYLDIFPYLGDENRSIADIAYNHTKRWPYLFPYDDWDQNDKVSWFKSRWKPENAIWYPEIAELAGMTQDTKFLPALLQATQRSATAKSASAAILGLGQSAVASIINEIKNSQDLSLILTGLDLIKQIAKQIGRDRYNLIYEIDVKYTKNLVSSLRNPTQAAVALPALRCLADNSETKLDQIIASHWQANYSITHPRVVVAIQHQNKTECIPQLLEAFGCGEAEELCALIYETLKKFSGDPALQKPSTRGSYSSDIGLIRFQTQLEKELETGNKLLLWRYLENPNSNVRNAAQRSLQEIYNGTEAELPALLTSQIESDSDFDKMFSDDDIESANQPFNSILVLSAIQALPPQEQHEHYLQRFWLSCQNNIPDTEIVREARQSLVALAKNNDRTRIYLENIAADTDRKDEERIAAVDLLGEIGNAASKPTLEKILGVGIFSFRDDNEILCGSALKSLRKIEQEEEKIK